MKRKVTVLGIESTAHTFGVGIATSEGEILANVNYVYTFEKGIHPREAAEHHSSVAHKAVKEALDKAGLSIHEIDAIAIALGPGLGPCLRIGATVARALSLYFNKPLVPVNHCVAHIEIARLTTGAEDPLVVYVSGGNTIVSAFVDGRYRVFGETLDIALGNCIDAFAREVGLPQPGVPNVEKMAERGSKYIPLPYVVKGQDLSFSGLLTMALRKVREGERLEDVCFSLIETAYSMLAEVAERALAHTKKKQLVLTGGVARSRRLQEMLREVAAEHGAEFHVVPPEYAGDNGAMIAWCGVLAYIHGVTIPVEESCIRQRWRLDEVDIPWRR
ncbi:MAG: bifunctional N(6)-L-threonylcarbamoyladenine synthase/serine/threonine protein kinase [Thermoprotei archaeon]|nr:MAG: bifunctional N(6)-L-threonylcarbamoyladenine synthase/serine/threonine protein kinase [Thermoprotei archaeon]